jgi:hypothetical protein
MVWLFIGIALAALSLAVMLRRLLIRNLSAKRLVPWMCMFVSAWFLISYAQPDGHSPFLLVIGTLWLVAAVLVLPIYSKRTRGASGRF